jgi:hypothetical protein
MATLTNVSSPANGTAAVFSLLTQLCAAGWRVKRWSDATTLSSDNVNLTSNPYGGSGSGAGNLGNTSAWFRVAASGGSREWLFQRGASDASWFVSRSIAGFTGTFAGTITAVVTGSATDATPLFGTAATSASNQANTTATLFSATPGRWFISGDDGDGFGWTAYAIPVGGGNVLTFLSDEPLLTGNSAAEDTDPYLWLGYYNATGLAATGTFIVTSNSAVLGYKRYTTAASNQRITYGTIHMSSNAEAIAPAVNTSTQQMGQTPVGGLEVPWQIPVFRNAAASTSSGWAGVPSRHRWCTVGGRANGDKLVSGADNWLYAAGLWVKWDSSTPTLS